MDVINLNVSLDVPFVTNYSITKITSKLMFEGMEKHSRVKFAENHSNVIRHLLVTAKLCMKVVPEISIAIFVVYGNFTSVAKTIHEWKFIKIQLFK